MRYCDEKVEAARNFANKLWNASRFVQMNLPRTSRPRPARRSCWPWSDKWILCQLVNDAGQATSPTTWISTSWASPSQKLYDFIWDSVLRLVHRALQGPPERRRRQAADTARKVLVYVLDRAC